MGVLAEGLPAAEGAEVKLGGAPSLTSVVRAAGSKGSAGGARQHKEVVRLDAAWQSLESEGGWNPTSTWKASNEDRQTAAQ